MGALTTMAVMVILAFGRFRGFAELGIICSIGIVSIYVAMYTLCPALFLRFAKGGAGRRQPGARRAGWSDGSSLSERDRRGARRFAALQPRRDGAAPSWSRRRCWQRSSSVSSARRVRFAYTGEELTVKNQKSLEIDRMILAHYGENVDQTVTLADTEERGRRIQDYFERHFGDFKTIARYESAFTYATPLDAAVGRPRSAWGRSGAPSNASPSAIPTPTSSSRCRRRRISRIPSPSRSTGSPST